MYRISVFALTVLISFCGALPVAHAQVAYGTSAGAEVDLAGIPQNQEFVENFEGTSASAHAEIVGVVADSSAGMSTVSCLSEITDVADAEAFTYNTFFWDTFAVTSTSLSAGTPTTVTFSVALDADLGASSNDPVVLENDVVSSMIVGVYMVNLTNEAPDDDDVVEELFVGTASLDAVLGLTESEDLIDSGFVVSEVPEGTGYSAGLSGFTEDIAIDTTVGSEFSLKFSLETLSSVAFGLSDGRAIADLRDSLRIVQVQTEVEVELVRASGVTEQPPVADFSGSPTTGGAPLTVQFTNESTGTITSWSWEFGDGGTSTEQDPSHTYNTTGYFAVSLTVIGPGGSDAETKTDYIEVTDVPLPPVAAFSPTATVGDRPLTVDFTSESTGTITSWSWDFGDGYASTDQHPSHTYYFEGDYTVTLTVSGPGGSDTGTGLVYVDEPSSDAKRYKTVIDDIKVSYNKPTCFASRNELTGTLFIAVWGEEVGTLNVTVGKNAWTYWDSRCDIYIDAPDASIKKINLKGRPETLLYVCGQVGHVDNFALKYGSVGDTLYYGPDIGLGSDADYPPKKIAIKSGWTTAPLLGVSYPDFRFNAAGAAEDALGNVELPTMELKSKPFEVVFDDDIDEADEDLDELSDDEAADLAGALPVEMKAGYKFEWDDIKVSYSKPGCLAYYSSSDGTLTIEISESDGNLKVTCGKEAYLYWGDYCDIYIDAPDASIKTINLKGRPQRGDDPGIQLHVCGEVGYVKNFVLKYGSVGDTDSYGPDFGLYNISLEAPKKINITWGWTTAPLLGVSN